MQIGNLSGMEMIDKIVRLIEYRGLKQAEVERACGLSSARITKWKDGVGEPTATQVLRIADMLGVPVRFLIDDRMDRPTPEINEQQARILWMVERIGYDEAVRRLMAAPETQQASAPHEGGRRLEDDRPAHVVRAAEIEGPFGPIVPHGKGGDSPPAAAPTVTGRAARADETRKRR